MRKVLTSDFFKSNRRKLKKFLGGGAPIVLVAHGLMQRSNDTEYPFEQDRNFYYLTGIDEPDWVVVIDEDEEYLIQPQITDTEKIFNGAVDPNKIAFETGIERILSTTKGWSRLNNLKEIRTIVPTSNMLGTIQINPSKQLFLDKLKANKIDISAEILHLRTIKNEAEIEAIQKAIEITAKGFSKATQILDGAQTEAELEAAFTSVFTIEHVRHSYTPIVAASSNACTLHYTANSAKLPTSGLVLIDIGAQYMYYSADITRTLFIGEPNDRQKEVHAAVQTVFEKIFKIIKPNLTFEKYEQQVGEIMEESLSSLSLGSAPEAVMKYFPHAPSHGLGLDVHDALVGYDSFQPGMVFTLEPGVYIPEEKIGVRYEDDLLITEDGVKNLSKMIHNYRSLVV